MIYNDSSDKFKGFKHQIKYTIIFRLPSVPLYKKRRDTFKRTKTTGVIPMQGASARKTGRVHLPQAGLRQETTTSLTSSHMGQHSFIQNEGISEKFFLFDID